MPSCAHGPGSSQTPREHPKAAPAHLSTATGSLSKRLEGQEGIEREIAPSHSTRMRLCHPFSQGAAPFPLKSYSNQCLESMWQLTSTR